MDAPRATFADRLRRRIRSGFSDRSFLRGIHAYERQLAKLLAVLLAVVIGVTSLNLLIRTGFELAQLRGDWFDGNLILLLDRLLLILIALEVLQNITAYLRDHVVQIELVLLTALTAVARKVIVLPPGAADKPELLVGFGLIVVGLAVAYWLVRQAQRTTPRRLRHRLGSSRQLRPLP